MPVKGFFDIGDGITKGKGISALLNSKDGRNELIYLFGGVENIPSSVMSAKKLRIDPEEDGKASGSYSKSNDHLTGISRRLFRVSGQGCQAGALSRFPQAIGRSMVLLYSEPGQTVFDPFAGHNSRMDLCVKAGRHYIGCDISTEFMAFNKKRAKQLRSDYQEVSIDLHHCDSRHVPVADETGDFTITSPPYWDIEFLWG